MPLTWHWYGTDERVICFIFQEPWTSQEFREANRSANEVAQTRGYVIDAIFDLTNVSIVPRNTVSGTIDLIRHSKWEPHQGAAIVVGANPGVQMLMHVVNQLVPEGVLFLAKNMDHALQIVHELQASRSND